MGLKLDKNQYPNGTNASDFKCFGPPATKDGEFDIAKIADLGCFTQDGKDTNKYYHASVCQAKGQWYVYYEWGRTGASSPSFQFVQCSDESDAQDEFASQLMSKNVKRGEWATVAGIKTLTAKAGKDCYLVRPLTSRSVGLPDGKTIKVNDGAKVISQPSSSSSGKVKVASGIDSQTVALMRDLNVATVAYTRGAVSGGAIPTQGAIDEARLLLTEAQKRILAIGNKEEDQANDTEMRKITNILYSRIPKIKSVNAAVSSWVLNSGNILLWQNDLNAFESALGSSADVAVVDADPFGGMPMVFMEWVNPNSDIGKFLYQWWPNASRNRHSHVGRMVIKNIWRFERTGDANKLSKAQDKILTEKPKCSERPLFQEYNRPDLDKTAIKTWKDSNTSLVLHGTRTVNIKGILTKSILLPKQLVGVTITGALLGPGAYFADDWRKSDGYTSRSGSYYSSGSGAIAGRGAFMFAADVVFGEPHVAPAGGGFTSPPNGKHSIFGKAGYTDMGYSKLANNEWIVYDTNQLWLRYLVEYDTK